MNAIKLIIGLAALTIALTVHHSFNSSPKIAMDASFDNLKPFFVTDSLPKCGRWKENMPKIRDPEIYNLYMTARRLWRSKIEWKLSKVEAEMILHDVRTAADRGDWGAKSLMATFYREGLGPLPSNEVLQPLPSESIKIIKMAVLAGQPWGFYDLGTAYETGYGGIPHNEKIAWSYYLKAAELGSPDAQVALSQAYLKAERFDAQELMLKCAYEQGHGEAAFTLALYAGTHKKYQDKIQYCHEGVKFGSADCAAMLYLFFDGDTWGPKDEGDAEILDQLGFHVDPERKMRYQAIHDALKINPDLKLPHLDKILPLPPAKLPHWNGLDDALPLESLGPPTY